MNSRNTLLRSMHALAVVTCLFVLVRAVFEIGLFIFIFIPLLFFIIPCIVLQHIKVDRVLRAEKQDRQLLFYAAAQLMSVALMYVSIPGIADTTRVLLLGEFEVDESSLAARLFYLATLTSAVVFFVSTVKLRKKLKAILA